MDIFDRLERRIDLLPQGTPRTGLNAVKLHVGTAIKHLTRGEAENDETAFTDAILRCNHAFEGSVKEAFRVLAGSDPTKKTPASIEIFLKEGGVLRPKVLAQFENYRKEWRNPSTHDYLLDFDASEALLAIVSVTVFAVVLCDQIRGKLAFIAAQEQGEHLAAAGENALPWPEQVREAVRRFAVQVQTGKIPDVSFEDVIDVDEALAGFLSAEWPDRQDVSIEEAFHIIYPDGSSNFADILVKSNDGEVVIETRDSSVSQDRVRLAKTVNYVNKLLAYPSVVGAVVLFTSKEYDYTDDIVKAFELPDHILTVG